MPKSDNDNLDIPAQLREAMHQRYRRDISVSPSLDDTILRDAHLKLARRFWRRRAIQWTGAAAGIAAAIAVAVRVGHISTPIAPPPQVALRDDLNRDGRVDVLDAFYLAKQLEAGSKSLAWDINRDGKIDQSDVDTIAQNAVRVGGAS